MCGDALVTPVSKKSKGYYGDDFWSDASERMEKIVQNVGGYIEVELGYPNFRKLMRSLIGDYTFNKAFNCENYKKAQNMLSKLQVASEYNNADLNSLSRTLSYYNNKNAMTKIIIPVIIIFI